MEQRTNTSFASSEQSAQNERARKWKEQTILDAIRAKGYEADEIIVRTQ